MVTQQERQEAARSEIIKVARWSLPWSLEKRHVVEVVDRLLADVPTLMEAAGATRTMESGVTYDLWGVPTKEATT